MSLRLHHVLGLIIAVGIGFVGGVGGFAFFYARGHSYFYDEPEICANCHIMEPQLGSWTNSSHARVAVCNDCHTPKGLIPKYISKADNGFRHAWAFTLDSFPEPIQIIPRNQRALQDNCLRCHQSAVHGVVDDAKQPTCFRCHKEVGHSLGPY